jgi:DNA-binding MarR family transcriptional regulator
MAEEPFDAVAESRRQWMKHGFPEPTAMAAGMSIMHAQRLVATATDRALRAHGLTLARYDVLMLLRFSRNGTMPMTQIGEALFVHPTGITKLVDKLEKDGLVQRERNGDDRRGVLARITPAGLKLTDEATLAVTDVKFGTTLDDDDLELLIILLRRMRLRAGTLGSLSARPE